MVNGGKVLGVAKEATKNARNLLDGMKEIDRNGVGSGGGSGGGAGGSGGGVSTSADGDATADGKDKGAIDQRDVLVTITGQGVAGGGTLGASGPFRVVHAISVRGSDAAPDVVGGQSIAPGGAVPVLPAGVA